MSLYTYPNISYILNIFKLSLVRMKVFLKSDVGEM